MTGFPVADPIPLPAPVWLLKTLHITTLSLHFVAVEVLMGGLLIASLLALIGRTPESRTTSRAMARRLPVVMTYVINLGVPPLLFSQVLYGRALYTSSVMIGAYWISVILLLMACYWLLYRFSGRLESGRSAWWIGLSAWVLAGFVARIYSSNMTLMLRPEAWPAMYAKSASGTQLPTGDPTLALRWVFMLGGGLLVAGLWMLYLAGRRTFADKDKRYMASLGGKLAAVMAVVEVFGAVQVVRSQPASVRAGLEASSVYRFSAYAWLGAISLIVLVGLFAGIRRWVPAWLSWAAPVIAILLMGSMTIYRDGIRDLTLSAKGLDVWQQAVETNWGVVGLFLFLFVAGLGVLVWLVSVVAKAKSEMESA